MAVTDHQIHSGYSAKFGTVVIDDLQSVEPSPNVNEIVARVAGAVDPCIRPENFREPQIRVTAKDLAGHLADVSPITGAAISAAWKVQYQQRVDGGLFAGAPPGTNHVTLDGTKGFLYVDEFGAEQDAPDGADLSLMFYALKNGANAAIAMNLAATLSDAPACAGVFKLGPVRYESDLLKGVQSSRVRPNITYEAFRESGASEAEIGSITERDFQVEIGGHLLEVVNDIDFKADLSSGIEVYYRKAGAADNDAVHVKVAITAGTYVVESVPVQTPSGHAVPGIRINATDPTGISYATNAQIPSS